MLSYCLKCKKNIESINPIFSKTTNGKTMMLSKCAVCGSKQKKKTKNSKVNKEFKSSKKLEIQTISIKMN